MAEALAKFVRYYNEVSLYRGPFSYILLSINTGVKKSVRYTMDFVIERFVIWWFHCKVQTLHLRMKRLLTMYTIKDPATETMILFRVGIRVYYGHGQCENGY